jgi:hypothetical protein
MSGNRTDFDTDDDREHFDPAFEESFQEEPITIRLLKFVREILTIQLTIQTRKKISTPPFSQR